MAITHGIPAVSTWMPEVYGELAPAVLWMDGWMAVWMDIMDVQMSGHAFLCHGLGFPLLLLADLRAALSCLPRRPLVLFQSQNFCRLT
jgi:hypothetical protein